MYQMEVIIEDGLIKCTPIELIKSDDSFPGVKIITRGKTVIVQSCEKRLLEMRVTNIELHNIFIKAGITHEDVSNYYDGH